MSAVDCPTQYAVLANTDLWSMPERVWCCLCNAYEWSGEAGIGIVCNLGGSEVGEIQRHTVAEKGAKKRVSTGGRCGQVTREPSSVVTSRPGEVPEAEAVVGVAKLRAGCQRLRMRPVTLES